MDLNCTGPLIHAFCPINVLENFLEIFNNLKNLTDEPRCSLEILKELRKNSIRQNVQNICTQSSLSFTIMKYIQIYYKKLHTHLQTICGTTIWHYSVAKCKQT